MIFMILQPRVRGKNPGGALAQGGLPVP